MWPGTGLNRRHEDFQSSALPTELPGRRYQMISRHPDATTRDLLPLTMPCLALRSLLTGPKAAGRCIKTVTLGGVKLAG